MVSTVTVDSKVVLQYDCSPASEFCAVTFVKLLIGRVIDFVWQKMAQYILVFVAVCSTTQYTVKFI